MPWFFAVAERDHSIQNPTSPEKIRRLGEHLRLDPQSSVLDVAAGRCGPALVLAERFGCRITAIEQAPDFVAAARERIEAADLAELIDVVQTDAKTFPLARGAHDVALCLGASFIWSGLEQTLAALVPTVRRGGHVVVGEPFWREWPLPAGVDSLGFLDLIGTTRRFEAAGLTVIGLITSSDDDWDVYESLHWRAVEEWLAAHPDDPDAGSIRSQHQEARTAYLDHRRELLGWAIVIGWKAPRLQSSVQAG